MTIVVNLKKEPYDVYIGRLGLFGNPHPIGWCAICRESHDRRSCIEAYRKHFRQAIRDRAWRKEVEQLKGKRLGCFCKPQACHGDVIREWLEKEGEYKPTGETWTVCSKQQMEY